MIDSESLQSQGSFFERVVEHPLRYHNKFKTTREKINDKEEIIGLVIT